MNRFLIKQANVGEQGNYDEWDLSRLELEDEEKFLASIKGDPEQYNERMADIGDQLNDLRHRVYHAPDSQEMLARHEQEGSGQTLEQARQQHSQSFGQGEQQPHSKLPGALGLAGWGAGAAAGAMLGKRSGNALPGATLGSTVLGNAGYFGGKAIESHRNKQANEEELQEDESNIPLGMGLIGGAVGAYPGMMAGEAAATAGAERLGNRIGVNRAQKTLDSLRFASDRQGINPRRLIEAAGAGTAQKYRAAAEVPGIIGGAAAGAAALGGAGYLMGKGIDAVREKEAFEELRNSMDKIASTYKK